MQRDFYRSARFHFGITCPMKQAIGDKVKDASFQTPATDLQESTNIEEELYRLFEILGKKSTNLFETVSFLNYNLISS